MPVWGGIFLFGYSIYELTGKGNVVEEWLTGKTWIFKNSN